MALLLGPRQDQPRLRSATLLGGAILGVLLGAGVVTAASCGGPDVRFCVTDLGPLPATGPSPLPAVSSGRVLGGAGTGGSMAVRPVDHLDYLQTIVDPRGASGFRRPTRPVTTVRC